MMLGLDFRRSLARISFAVYLFLPLTYLYYLRRPHLGFDFFLFSCIHRTHYPRRWCFFIEHVSFIIVRMIEWWMRRRL